MGETCNGHVEDLRKRSRVLLASIERNSKKIKKEFKKLQQQKAASTKSWNCFRKSQGAKVGGNLEFWNRRNDSSGVNAVLCPDYFCGCPKSTSASVPNMSSKKFLISSKKCLEDVHARPCNRCVEHRKPVKGCYCTAEVNRGKLRSPRTRRRSSYKCDECKNRFNVIQDKVQECIEKKKTLCASISTETLRRVQKIDYTPRSQFLRNVQSKVSVLPSTERNGNPSNLHRYSLSNIEREDENIDENQSKIKSNNSLLKDSLNLEVGEHTYMKKNSIQKSSKGIQGISRNLQPKFAVKKIIPSKTAAVQTRQEESASEVLSRDKRDLKFDNEDAICTCECTCNAARLAKKFNYNNLNKNNVCPTGHCHETRWHGGRQYQEMDGLENRLEEDYKDVRDLRKFRDQNYFDTHGSSQTLLSSRSSGSLQQFYLNDRLFPEPVRKIHRRDLIVTMPPCATVQRKRVHYFPKYIVPQEKNSYNTNYKKRRSQGCPLTGHAIDLGVLKTSLPLNSLALRHQKRLL